MSNAEDPNLFVPQHVVWFNESESKGKNINK